MSLRGVETYQIIKLEEVRAKGLHLDSFGQLGSILHTHTHTHKEQNFPPPVHTRSNALCAQGSEASYGDAHDEGAE